MATIGVTTNPPAPTSTAPTPVVQSYQVDVYDNSIGGQVYPVTLPYIPQVNDQFQRNSQSSQLYVQSVVWKGDGGNVMIVVG